MVLHNSSSPAIVNNHLKEINQMKFLKHPHIVCYLGVEMNMNTAPDILSTSFKNWCLLKRAFHHCWRMKKDGPFFNKTVKLYVKQLLGGWCSFTPRTLYILILRGLCRQPWWPLSSSTIEGHTKKKLISAHEVIFCFGITRYSIVEFFVFGLGFWYSMLLTWIVYPCPRCQWHYCFLREFWSVCYWFCLVSGFW